MQHEKLHIIIMIFFTYTSGKSAKLFTRKLCQACCMKPVCAYNLISWKSSYLQPNLIHKRMLIAQDCIRFYGHIAWQTFLVNNFAGFQDVVWIKKQDLVQLLVAFCYSNICYWN